MSQAVTNGHPPSAGGSAHHDADSVALAVELMVHQLRELIAGERSNRLDAERLVAESREREKRLTKALAALEGESPPKPRSSPRPQRQGDWQISEEKVELVFDAIKRRRAEVGRPVTQTEVAEANAGLSPESMRRGLDVLRAQERVRIAGRVRGGGRAWDLMPEAVADGA